MPFDFLRLIWRWFTNLSLVAQLIVLVVALGLYAAWLHMPHNTGYDRARVVHSHGERRAPYGQGATQSADGSAANAPSTGPLPTAATNSADCGDKLPFGAPVATNAPATALGSVREVCRLGYAVGHSSQTKTPLWSAEHLVAGAIGGAEPRTNVFLEDTSLPAGERATLNDYKRSGYDRGHMSPAGDFSRSAQEMAESFYLSNMVPQNGPLNRGPWAKLEGHVRETARSAGGLYVITGPVFQAGGYPTIGPGHVGVPQAIYKIVLDTAHGRMSAWLVPNDAVPEERLDGYCTSVDKVEQATGLTFFPQLPAAQRATLKSMKCAF